MVQDTSSFKVEKLNSDNYHSWKFNIKMFLIGKDLWDIVDGSEVLENDADAETRNKFKKRDNMALATICLSISTGLQIYVRSAVSAKQAWDVLQNHFEEKTLSKKIFYRRKLYSARMSSSGDMATHINYVKTLAEHLQAVDDPVAEKDLTMILISSLTDDYNNLITALETMAEEKLTWDYVRDRAITEHDRIKGSSSKGHKNEALLVKDSRGQKTEQKYKQKYKCHYCQEPGHFQRDCRKKKAAEQKKNDKKPVEKSDKKVSNHASYAQIDASGTEVLSPEFALKLGVDAGVCEWWIDSGASQHMTMKKDELLNYKSFDVPLRINLADDSFLLSYGTGNVSLKLYSNNESFNIVLHDVLYVPKIQAKLLSLPDILKKGAEVRFKGSSCFLIINGREYVLGHRHGKLFKLNCDPVETCCFSTAIESPSVWHMRFGHLGYDNLRILYDKRMVAGMKLNTEPIDKNCESCIMGKHNRTPFPKKSQRKTTNPLEVVYSDVCGPMSCNSIGGSRYFVTFVDDFSRYVVVYTMKHKSEVLSKFKQFLEMAETLHDRKLKVLQSDNGGEYNSNEFRDFLIERGIQKYETIPYSPQQNGVAERTNRTLMEKVRCMLHHSGLTLKFWAEALSTATYVKNRSPTSAFGEGTPFERWYKQKPDVEHLRVFGCRAYAHVPDEKRKKLDRKSTKCIFIGYPDHSKGYKLFDPVSGKILLSRDVIFVENDLQNSAEKTEQLNELLPDDWFEIGAEAESVGYEQVLDYVPENIGHEAVEQVQIDIDAAAGEILQEHEDPVQIAPEGRPHRVRNSPDRFGEWEYLYLVSGSQEEPRSFREALRSDNSEKWKEAADTEMHSLMKNETWELVKLPTGKTALGCKWVFKNKDDPDGGISRYKARLVAQGCSQKYGVDYQDVFAPVVKYNSIRTVLAIANEFNMEVHQMDVKSAYLNGEIDTDIYMRQPEGYVDSGKPELVCKLKKSLYGLKQSGRCWNIVIDKYLKMEGYTQSTADPCIYVKIESRQDKSVLMLIALYVDDTVLCCNDMEFLKAEKLKLCSRFEMEDMGEIHHLLGMTIRRSRETKTMTIDQKCYLEKVLKRFGMADCKPVATPMEPGKHYGKSSEAEEGIDIGEYQAIIGSLIYASIATRPDLSASVGVLSRFMAKPGREHWAGVKRVLRYIKGTLDHGLKFVDCDDFSLYGYSDADWAGEVDSRRSTSGYLFRLGGCSVSWRSKRQTSVALSSTEAEYIALCSAAQEAVWLRNLMQSVHVKQEKATTIHEDNQGAIVLARNPKDHPRTKHIEIKYHYVRETVEKNHINLKYCPTKEMVADIFTKALPRPAFESLRSLMGVCRVYN